MRCVEAAARMHAILDGLGCPKLGRGILLRPVSWHTDLSPGCPIRLHPIYVSAVPIPDILPSHMCVLGISKVDRYIIISTIYLIIRSKTFLSFIFYFLFFILSHQLI